jgi:DNA polymerase-3 subunit delta
MSVPQLQALARDWPAGLKMVLLHGYEQGLIADHADTLTRSLVDPGNPAGLERLSSEQLQHDPQALLAAVSAISMFGGRVVVRVDGVDDRSAPALVPVLQGAVGNPLILVGSRLKAGGALLSLLARDRSALVVEVKSLGPGQVLDTVREMAEALGMRCDRQTAQLLVDATGGERSLLRSELEKLALYLDAAPERLRTLESEAVQAVAAGTEFFDHAGLATAAVAGRAAEVVTRLSQLPTGEGVVILRFLAGRLATLAEIRTRIDAGAAASAALDAQRPPVFFKDKPVYLQAAQRWSTRGLAAALRAVLSAEMALKARGGLSDLEAQALVLRVAKSR